MLRFGVLMSMSQFHFLVLCCPGFSRSADRPGADDGSFHSCDVWRDRRRRAWQCARRRPQETVPSAVEVRQRFPQPVPVFQRA